MGEPLVLFLALALDAWLGDPDWLWRRLPHPVVLFGVLIDRADEALNVSGTDAATRRARGAWAIAGLVAVALGLGVALEIAFAVLGPLGMALEIVVVAIMVAQRSLHDHVRRVADALDRDGLPAARRAVAMIVGRDPDRLDRAGVAGAAIESLAENTADGVVAPVLWYAIGGLPGLLACKMVNTADSMIGHRTDRHLHFGRAAARLDDAMMWLPARATALLVTLAAPRRFRAVMAAARVDAARHRSPNAGWPEAAWAAATGLALGGPRSYGEGVRSEPVLNAAGRRPEGARDIRASLRLFVRGCAVQAGLVAVWMIA